MCYHTTLHDDDNLEASAEEPMNQIFGQQIFTWLKEEEKDREL